MSYIGVIPGEQDSKLPDDYFDSSTSNEALPLHVLNAECGAPLVCPDESKVKKKP